jgi:biopolymer transport protein ExbD
MALVPFIDMLTMLVVFLLLHSSDAEILPNTKNIQIPQSIADLKPRETVTIMVTKDELLVNGRVVGKVAEVAALPADKMIIPDLQVALKEHNDSIQRAAAQTDIAEREITIMGDKGTPFSVLKRVMATATASDYGKVSLAVIQRETEAGA